MNDEVRVLRKGTCPSLSSRSTLTYEFGLDDKSKTVLFRIAENTGSGHFSSAWIPLDDILDLLDKAKEPFSLNVFKPLYSGQSLNNLGFLGAVLLRENLVVPEKRKYLRKDLEPIITEMKKLSRPTKSAAKKTTPKP